MEVTIHNQTNSGEKGEHKILINKNDKIKEFINYIKQKLNIKLNTNRIGIFFLDKNNKKVYLTNKEKSLGNYGVDDFSKIILKDFGTQVDWRLVYIVEYLGPLLIFPCFYFGLTKPNLAQKMGLIMGIFHFLKRILESIFVHKFSRETMPIKNLFINIFYYWVLFGVSCGYSLFNRNYSNSIFNNYGYVYFCLFYLFEYMNFKCHMLQKKAKMESQGQYKILPGIYGFQYVSCANYFWEFLSWLVFSLFTNLPNFYIFTFCGLYVMTKWAKEKHSNFKMLFGNDYPKERKAILPFLI